MNNGSFIRWKQIHASTLELDNLPRDIKKSWELCYSMELEPYNSYPKCYSDEEFNMIKDESRRLFTHAHYRLKNMCQELKTSNFGFALFSPHGCLLKLYGSEKFLAWAKTDLKGSEKRARGNALSNIKKAIHSRIDEIINSTHIVYAKDWDPRIGTVDKLEILKKLDTVVV